MFKGIWEERMRGFLFNKNKNNDKKVFLLSLWLSILTVGVTGIICFLFMDTYMNNQLHDGLLLQKFVLSLVILLFFIIPFSYLAIRKLCIQIYDPVRQISAGFNEISRGNFNVKLEIEEKDLSDQFNHMTSQLAILVEKLAAT